WASFTSERLPKMASASSKNRMALLLDASSKMRPRFFSVSPMYLLTTVDKSILYSSSPSSEAITSAAMVLPVPGGPANRMVTPALVGRRHGGIVDLHRGQGKLPGQVHQVQVRFSFGQGGFALLDKVLPQRLPVGKIGHRELDPHQVTVLLAPARLPGGRAANNHQVWVGVELGLDVA